MTIPMIPQINSLTSSYDGNFFNAVLSYTIITVDVTVEIEMSRIGNFVKVYPFALTTGNYTFDVFKLKSETTHSFRARTILQGVPSNWTSYFSITTPAYPTNLPSLADNLYYPQTLNQWVANIANGSWSGQAQNCVATSLATVKEIHEKRERGISYLPYSIGWIYGNRLPTDLQGEGMKMGEALNRLQAEGVPQYKLLPENVNRNYPDNYYYYDNVIGTYDPTPVAIGAKTLVNNNKYTSTITTDAVKQKIDSWTQYDNNDWLGVQNGFGQTVIETIKQRVIDDGCALLGMGIPHAFDRLLQGSVDSLSVPDYISTGYIPDDVGSIRAYHAVVIIGWKIVNGRTWWIIHNNWNAWGDSADLGRAYMPLEWDYIESFYLIKDYVAPVAFAWTVTPLSGVPFYISYSDWNKLTEKINSIRASKGLSTISFTPVSTGMSFSASIFNEVINGFAGLSYTGILPSLQITGNNIYASHFVSIQNAVNSIV